MSKYTVNQHSVQTLLGWVQSGHVAIPELQRPFVWSSTKVRDLLDSLYKGYPVGYLITWQSVGAALKDGGVAAHQQILIDGQQRITALRAAISGLDVVDKHYRKQRITIAFDPVGEQFATLTPVIAKNPQWIPDVAKLFNATSTFSFMSEYFSRNPDLDPKSVEASFGRLESIRNAQIGIIALADELDVETVSEIFIRINSKGVPLSSGDFAMSKIATYGDRGRNLRKLIDYFCHLAVTPHVHSDIIANDPSFAASPYMKAINWLRNDTEDLYNPEYGDLIRVANLVGFDRGKVSALVSELSGRDPETRKVDESRIPLAYDRLETALLQIVKKYEFENFVMTIKSAGFIEPSMIGSMNAMNFSYALYLRLRKDSSMSEGERQRIVRKWFVMSMLTGRHSGSFESTWEQDIRRISAQGAAEYLKLLEESELSDAFWDVQLPASLDTSSPRSPYFQAFLAAQVSAGARGFLSKAITVQAMQEQSGDIHHIMPKDYLRKSGFPDRADYNQVANYVLTETAINIRIGNRAPNVYMTEVHAQIESGMLSLGAITSGEDLQANFRENVVPKGLASMTATDYPTFLDQRRKLMAAYIKDFYNAL
ncbi:GmrSD restriction endonuclease domain-containing protein [Rhodococcus erythropolis]|uniref:GmrSD restriction endonuclease domain-containing protein n=1 Tax=Rhodococcus erythropolis TaxID=1833 RepID=UPI0036DD9977